MNPAQARAQRKSRGRRGDEEASEGSADRNLHGLLTESLGSSVVASAGNPPRWLAFGIGTYLASQIEPRSPYYQQLRQTAFANCQQGWPTRANEALGGSDQLTPDGLHSISFAFVEAMMSPEMKQGFPSFANGMLAGTEKLDDMLQRVYRRQPRGLHQFLGRVGRPALWTTPMSGGEPAARGRRPTGR